MKFNYNDEFDLKLIYKKLISPCKPATVKACDFFKVPELCSLEKLQYKMERLEKLSERPN